jgi:uncharacterized protein
VAGPPDDAAATALAGAALSSPDPATCVLRTLDGADWAGGSPGHGKTTMNGAPAAYVCRGRTCSLPVTTAQELRRLLAGARPAAD